jgi:spermidine/putrescine transport system ATP-binding protein
MVELLGVTKRFGSFVATDAIDLTIQEGEFLTLLGPSGCGKTTLLRMISGFETPTEGKVLLGGQDVTFLPPYQRNVNQVFQSYALFPHMTVWENICFGLKMKNVAKEEMDRRVKDVVELVSLTGMEQRRPSQLSGGQRQRVALARAIVCQPKVLLLDEPLSALDAKLRHQMQIELKRLQQRLGITFVFVTHDQEEALTMSDRIAVINKGKIEQLDKAASIYHTPKTTFVANFIGEANILDARIIACADGKARLLVEQKLELTANMGDLRPESTKVLVSIRPERVRLFAGKPEGDNVFEVEVAEEIFKGAMDEFTVRTQDGLELSAAIANEGGSQIEFHPGDNIFCQLQRDDIVIVQQS